MSGFRVVRTGSVLSGNFLPSLRAALGPSPGFIPASQILLNRLYMSGPLKPCRDLLEKAPKHLDFFEKFLLERSSLRNLREMRDLNFFRFEKFF